MNDREIGHLVFLAEVVLNSKKKALMDETYRCLLFLVKGLQTVELTDAAYEQVQQLIASIEAELRDENERIRDINGELTHHGRRKPLG